MQTISTIPQYYSNHLGSQPVDTPQSVCIKGQFIPTTPQSFSVNSKPISSTSISSVSGSLSNTIDIFELLKDSLNPERWFFSNNSKMGQIP